MSEPERPLAADEEEHDQQRQVELVRETGNAPTDADEEAVLAGLYGEPDSEGVYRGGEQE